MYYLYILKSLKNSKYYIGVTSNIKRRLKEHNNGHSKSTKYARPYDLLYSEKFESINEAYKREKYLKRNKKRSFIEKLIKLNG